MQHEPAFPDDGEALIQSLSNFILGFKFNARNQSTRIASYLRRLMTQHWTKIHMKFDSANEAVLPRFKAAAGLSCTLSVGA